MSEKLPPCQDFDYCGSQSDPKYTMDFTDVPGGGFIYWCADCGPVWAEVDNQLKDRLEYEPGFAQNLEKAMVAIGGLRNDNRCTEEDSRGTRWEKVRGHDGEHACPRALAEWEAKRGLIVRNLNLLKATVKP